MYKKTNPAKTSLKVNKAYQGESLEKKIARILVTKEPIKDVAHPAYTERKDGVLPQYDIRHDKWETAVDLTTKVSQSHTALRDPEFAKKAKENMDKEKKTETKNEAGGQSAETTEPK